MLNKIKVFWADEEGVEIVEIMLALAVVVAIGVIFRDQVVLWFNKLLGQAQDNMNTDHAPIKPAS